jgi:RNA polymerase sigma-70 factor, ECF subfamily
MSFLRAPETQARPIILEPAWAENPEKSSGKAAPEYFASAALIDRSRTVTAISSVLTDRNLCSDHPAARVSVRLESDLVEYEDTLLKIARGLTGNDAHARDLVQDTFLRAIEKKSSFRPGTMLRAWLVAILNHRFVDLCRRDKARGVHQPVEGLNLEQSVPEPPPRWAAIDGETLRRTAEKLPPELRELYRLNAFEGLSYAEVAARLGIPQNTVGTRLFRARKQLRELLEKEHA